MANYPTQLDEIDQWLFDSFGILPGACSSTENLRHTTARMVAESLWPKLKNTSQELEEAARKYSERFKKEIEAELKKLEDPSYEGPTDEREIAYCDWRLSHTSGPAPEEEVWKAACDWQKENDKQRYQNCFDRDEIFRQGVKKGMEYFKDEIIKGAIKGYVSHIDRDNNVVIHEKDTHLRIACIPIDRLDTNIKSMDNIKIVIFKDNEM